MVILQNAQASLPYLIGCGLLEQEEITNINSKTATALYFFVAGSHFGCRKMMVAKNTFTSNGWGMRVQASCENNTITQNNYFSNTFDVGTNGTMQLNKFISNYWDKYEGYDLNKDGYGDIHYQPVSLYSMIVEKMPAASVLLRSFMVTIMDKAETVIPSITPIELKDGKPLMKPLAL